MKKDQDLEQDVSKKDLDTKPVQRKRKKKKDDIVFYNGELDNGMYESKHHTYHRHHTYHKHHTPHINSKPVKQHTIFQYVNNKGTVITKRVPHKISYFIKMFLNKHNSKHVYLIREGQDELIEAHLSDTDKEQRETYVKGMKPAYREFIKRYGKKAKQVMYATATKLALKH